MTSSPMCAIGSLDLNYVGYGIVALFVARWAIALVVWRLAASKTSAPSLWPPVPSDRDHLPRAPAGPQRHHEARPGAPLRRPSVLAGQATKSGGARNVSTWS